ncbi:MAG: hypothetical protein KGZ64_00320 [Thermaerobacter sp.]|nr:hypothetical protein [Thermaerobacter sp.]
MQVPIITVGTTLVFMLLFAKLLPKLADVKSTRFSTIVGSLVGGSAGLVVGAALDGIKFGYPLTIGLLLVPTLVTVVAYRIFGGQHSE